MIQTRRWSQLTYMLSGGLLGLVFAGSILASGAQESSKRAMTLVDLVEVPQLRDPQLAPDGTAVVYVLHEADWKANKRIPHIWRQKTDGGDATQLTNGESGETSPRYSPDGTSIAFVAKRGKDENDQIYLLDSRGGEAMPLTSHPTSVSRIQWAPDGESLFFLASEPKSEEEKRKDKLGDDVFAFDENFKHRHLWRVNLDGEETQVTRGEYSVLSFSISTDGSRMAFHRSISPLFDDSDEGEAWIMDADGTGARRLTENTVAERNAEISPDGEWVLFVADANDAFETYYNDNIFVVPSSGGDHRMLLPEMPHEVQSAHWAPDSKSIYFLANTGIRSELFQVELESESLNQLTRGDHSVSGWSYRPDAGSHAVGLNHRTNAGDIHVLSLSGGESRQVTHVFDYLDEQFRLPRQESISWNGDDGERVEGLLFYPLDYREGTRYPLIVQTHGGPAASDKFGFGRWSNYQQVAAAMGYFVFKPNYRGSTGYGDAFLRDMVGHYFRQAHLDVMTGVDHLIGLGLVDGDRMVKMGWSGGGHMTNKIITHTDRFKAASSGAGAVNWVSMYGQSDVRIYRTPWFGGTPWQEDAPISTYWEHSPLKDIYKVKTPTIVLVGENDVRVPPPQSVELYRALKSNGVESHLYIAPREPHGWRELRHELFKTNVELDWFERHCMGRDYEWESAPGDDEPSEDAAKPTEPAANNP